ncbi:M48 family metalloprotease [Leisingera sp. MMG026]|uniref:M48 family metalloprotease n=1 Tax=Leisingera sp. MMG026 TaxID=2909982 RepID=UPI001F44F0CD|nr:M48 family metalloprotease [Leisingera sp. MMG026]MCF6432196.1 hypothetical protein [Leisingera sp. MMG026]
MLGRHIEKQKQQALAGALILGVITAAATADSGYYDPSLVTTSMDVGAAADSTAYSQTYELERDTLGTRIAHASGYDPVEDARFFARPEAARTKAGRLSFWGTHPPDAKRLATVLATMEQIDAKADLQKNSRSSNLGHFGRLPQGGGLRGDFIPVRPAPAPPHLLRKGSRIHFWCHPLRPRY